MVSQLWDQGRIVEGLNAIKWSPDDVQDLENTVLNGLTGVACASVSRNVYTMAIAKFDNGDYSTSSFMIIGTGITRIYVGTLAIDSAMDLGGGGIQM